MTGMARSAHFEVQVFDGEVRLHDASGANARTKHILLAGNVIRRAKAHDVLEVVFSRIVQLEFVAPFEKAIARVLDRRVLPHLLDQLARCDINPAVGVRRKR